jgi:hypothetical protein
VRTARAEKLLASRLAGLAAACVLGVVCAATAASGEKTVTAASVANSTTTGHSSWAADPATAGPNLPPAGRSLFDFLFTDIDRANTDQIDINQTGSYRVPFPFSSLIERVAARLGNDEFMGGIRVAIIPMGRSLQRVAAAPDFFKYPRTVIAATGEPRTDSHDAGMLLKDRLYIAYVEKTATLEVISYNEAAGRFEFQLVKDYRAGAQPNVFYADRAICISCHQNHAPIFSLPTWRETNANGKVADLLRAHATDMHLSAQANIDFPDDMEKATMRANDLVTLQTVWQQGCTDERDPARSQRCRAAAFAAILQYGLSGKHDFDSNAARYRNDFVSTISRTWSRRWPQGLRVAQSSLPDRNPFGGTTSSYASGGSDQSAFDWIVAANVPPALDPLTPRPPKEIWHFAGAMDTARMISGWSGFFATDDFRTLDRALVAHSQGASRTMYRAQCTASKKSSSSRVNLNCSADPRAERPINLVAWINKNGKGRIEWMNFGPAGTVRDVELTGSPAQLIDSGYVLQAAPKKAAHTTRLPDGRRLESVEIRWSASFDQTASAQDVQAQFDAIVIDDFSPVNRAIDQLLQNQPALFDDVPLMRARLMPALLANLDLADQSSTENTSLHQSWCCIDDTAMPSPTIEAPEVDPAAMNDEKLQPFFRYCAMCHFTAEQFPPNFLSGKASRVKENLRHCAPRMQVRLSAWITPDGDRAKSPMPPATALHSLGTTTDQWANSNELAQLRAYIASLIRETGQSSVASAAAEEGYEALPSCLPPVQ